MESQRTSHPREKTGPVPPSQRNNQETPSPLDLTMTDLLSVLSQDPKVRNTTALAESENQHFGGRLWKNLSLDSALTGLINPQGLPNKKFGNKNFDLKNIMQ